MGTLQGNLNFTGSIDNLSAYKMRGHDKIIIRSKGGATKRRIQRDPAFESTRNLNTEWKGVTEAGSKLRAGIFALKPLADYNISGPINGLIKKIQVADTVNPKGKRSIIFSAQPDFFTGFSLNKQTLFDSLIRQPVTASIEKISGLTDVSIPSLQPLINFFPNSRQPYYRLVLICASLSDMTNTTADNQFYPVCSSLPGYKPVYTDWLGTKVISPAASYQLKPAFEFRSQPDMIIVFGIGIQYGAPGTDGTIQPVPFAGAAKILHCV